MLANENDKKIIVFHLKFKKNSRKIPRHSNNGFEAVICLWDLTQYRIGAVSLDACKNHDHKIDKYVFFADFYIFHSLSYINRCEKR
jgi:hypothetical protein